MGFTRVLVALALLASEPLAAQAETGEPDDIVRALIEERTFRAAAHALDAGHDQWVQDIITLTEIPAPPFKEQARAAAFADMLRSRGLIDVEIDDEGNVLGLRKGLESGPAIVISAHLDTVFPEGTDVKVRREGETLHAPGVGDDSAGLATVLALIDAINAAGLRTTRDLLIVGTVGEEGAGDLRGVRHLFTKGKYRNRIAAFFSFDGRGLKSFTRTGTGSKRYRVSYVGPGGHSYNAFGIVNPLAALGRTVADLYELNVPASPKTTFSASLVGGGTSVNAIPDKAWLEVDMRSVSPAELDKLEQQFLAIVSRAVETENRARSTKDGKVTVEAQMTGERPAGETPESANIVRFVEAAYRAEGIAVSSVAGSTDANMPMSLGIPAVTVSRVVVNERGHSIREWIGLEKAENVRLRRILLAAVVATANHLNQ
jgi:acetylornithine deacetylase/succinyl-diaminopimelate desuccinylase-like protein